MSISKRQFDHLSAMNIPIWQRRMLNEPNISSLSDKNNQQKINIPQFTIEQIELDLLLKQQIFLDVLLSMGKTSADIVVTDDHLDLGIINWYFITENKVLFNQQSLYTPKINIIAQSIPIKMQLWQVIAGTNTL